MDLHGLVIKSHAGREWRWTGHEFIENRHGLPVRCERWARECACGSTYEVVQKLPYDLARMVRKAFRRSNKLARLVRGWAALGFKPDPVPLAQRYGNFEIARCEECRRARRIQALV